MRLGSLGQRKRGGPGLGCECREMALGKCCAEMGVRGRLQWPVLLARSVPWTRLHGRLGSPHQLLGRLGLAGSLLRVRWPWRWMQNPLQGKIDLGCR